MSKNTYAGNTKYSRRIISRFLVLVAVLFVVFGAMSFALTRINVSANSAQIMNNALPGIGGHFNQRRLLQKRRYRFRVDSFRKQRNTYRQRQERRRDADRRGVRSERTLMVSEVYFRRVGQRIYMP